MTIRTSLAAAALIVSLPLAARAETMIARFPMYLHSGPGTAYAVIDEVPTKTALDVQGCNGGWCQVKFGAAYGWVTQRMLAAPQAAAPAAAATGDCFDFARTGWPNAGDLERVCYRNKPAQ